MTEPFIVRHYGVDDEERPIIKGNGFDGLEVGEDREEAEIFVKWVNAKLDRVKELEAALRKHGHHIGYCPKNLNNHTCDLEQVCTCGLDEATQSAPSPQSEPRGVE